MALTNLSQITTSGIATGTDLNIRNITGAAATFTGNVTVGGTLTYEDVTNIDSVGLITARSGINVTGGDVSVADKIVHTGDTDTSIRFLGPDTITAETAGSERLRITNSGLVGIGTVNPTTALEIRTTTTNAATHYRNNASNSGAYFGVRGTDLGAASAGEAYVYSYNSGINLLADGSGHIDFATGGTASKVRITSGGKVLINSTANSDAQLLVKSADKLHPALKLDSISANGFSLLGDEYLTDESNFTMGIAYSSASLVTGWGVKVSPTAVNEYLSSQDTYSTKHSAVRHDGDGWKFLSNSSSQTVTTDSVVSLTERFRISSTGNIGIGTDNPNTKLQIVTTSGARALTLAAPTLGPYMVFETNSTAFADIGSEAGLTGSGSNVDMLTLNARGSRSLSFRTNSTERIRITSAGKVGIDNANPNAKLEVKGIGGSTGLTFRGTDSSGNTNFWVQDGGRVGVHYYPFSINQDYSDSATPSGTYFYIHGNSPFIVKSDGKVGINQTAPAHQLDVKISDNTTYTPGNFVLNGAARLHNESTTTNSFASLVFRTASGDNAIGFVYPGTVNQADFVICNDGGANGVERFRITSGGSVGFNTSLTQSSKTVHIAGDYRTSTQNVADEGLIFQSFATASTGNVYPGISWTGNPGALGRARAAITAIATNDNNGSDLVFLTRNQADGTELDVSDDEKVRIRSNGYVGIGTDVPGTKLHVHGNGNESITLRLKQGTTPGNYSSLQVGRTDGAGNPHVTDAVTGGIPIAGIPGILLGSSNTGVPAVSIQSANSANGHIVFSPKGTEKVRITATGLVGIGDASPTKPLTVGTTTPVILLDDQSSRTLEIRGPSTTHIASILTTSGHSLLLGTNNSERLRIDSNGKIHVGGNGTGTDQFNLIAAGGGINIARMNSGDANVNEWLGALGFKGYATGNSSSGADARIHANAAFNHSGTSAPANLIFSTKGTTQGPGSSPLERMRITYDGKLGIGHAAGSQIAKELTIRPVNDGGIRFVRPGDNAGSPNIHLDLTTTTSGSVFPSGEAYTVKYNTYNNDQIFTTYVGGGTGGNISFKTATQGNTPAERLRIQSTGEVVISDGGTVRDQRMPLVITGRGFGHGTTSQGTTQDAIYLTAGASGNYSTLTLTVDKNSWGSVVYEIHAAAHSGRHLHRIGGFYQNGNSISGHHGTTTASSSSTFAISSPASQQFTMTISGGTWTHPSAWVRLVLSGSGILRSDLISFSWS